MALAPGSIAFVGYSADTDDGLAFVVLEPVLAGNVISFSSADAGIGGAEVTWNWTAKSDVAAGTVVTIGGLAGGAPSSDLGTVEAEDADRDTTGSIGGRTAHVGSSTAPTFLAEISNDFINPTLSIPVHAGSAAASARSLSALTSDISVGGRSNGAADLLAALNAQHDSSQSAADDAAAVVPPADEAATQQPGRPGDEPAVPAAPQFSDADDSLTNSGMLIGGVAMLGGNDTLVNSGTIIATDGAAIDMGAGNDTVTLLDGSNIFGDILLGTGNDQLTATDVDGDLDIDAGDGNDTVTSGTGDDLVKGGAGDDIIDGGEGDDALQGGDGNDRLLGGLGDDVLIGGAGNDLLVGGEGNDTIVGGDGVDTADYSDDTEGVTVNLQSGEATGDDTGRDTLSGIENVIGGMGNDVLIGNAQVNMLTGGEGDDRIVAGAGDSANGGEGDDTIEVTAGATAAVDADGGEGEDTIKLFGPGTGSLGPVAHVENLIVEGGSWTVTATGDYEEITVKNGGAITSGIIVDRDDRVSIEAGGKLIANNAMTWAGGGDAIVTNNGLIEGSRVLDTTAGATGSLKIENGAQGVIRGNINPTQAIAANAVVTVHNAGVIESSGRVLDFQNADGLGGRIVIENDGTIRQTGSDTDVLRPGMNGTINNRGTITTVESFVGGGDLIDFQADTGGKVNNYVSGHLEGSRHVVTGDHAVTVFNEGTMIGRNGSAVNIDNDGSEADRVNVTNRGVMEGRSAGLSDSDGDAVDVDGLINLTNYGRIYGLGHNGRHDGEANVSEGVAIGGGTIVNNAGAEIYGYGRGIQVDNSGNANALGKTLIVNDGTIRGDGHGPEGVTLTPEEVAKFDLRGNEAINLIGTYDDEIINGAAGRILGGLSMGGGNDILSNSGTIKAMLGSAIDMGAGNDIVTLYTGSNVEGTILLGDGNDRITMNGGLDGVTLDAGNGADDITTSDGNDVIHAGAGNDSIFASAGNDTIDAGAGDDTILADEGNDVIDGGDGFDTLFLARATGPVYVDFGAGAGHVSGAGIGFDTFTSIENLLFGEGNDTVIGGNADDTLDGGAGNDTLDTGAGDDTLAGSAGNDTLIGGSGDDELDGGTDNDTLSGGSGDDILAGGAGNDAISGGSNDDTIEGGAGDDVLTGGSGNDTFVFTTGFGNDRITDFTGSSADVIEFSTSVFADAAALLASTHQVGADVVITIDAHTSLTLEHTQFNPATFADDFRFV